MKFCQAEAFQATRLHRSTMFFWKKPTNDSAKILILKSFKRLEPCQNVAVCVSCQCPSIVKASFSTDGPKCIQLSSKSESDLSVGAARRSSQTRLEFLLPAPVYFAAASEPPASKRNKKFSKDER